MPALYVVSIQGNANTTVLAVKLRYNGSVVSSEYFENANYGVAYLAPRESGIHYIEFFAKNAQGDIYEAPSQEIDIQLPTIIQEVFESAADERIMQTEMQAGLLTNLVSNLVLQPAASFADVVDRVIDIDRYGYYDRQKARQDIVDNFRNGVAQYLGNPGYFYVGQVCGDVLSVGAEIYLTANGVKGIVKGVSTIKGGAKLVQLQTVGTYQPVVLLVDGVGIATSTTSVLQVGIASNAMLGNIQNAVTGNSSFGNTNYKIVNGYKAKVNIGQQNKHIPGTNEYQTAINNGQTKSIVYGDSNDVQILLDKKAGTGEFISQNKERVNFCQVIGKYVDPNTGVGTETTIGIIHYGEKGAHIVPARPN